MKNLERENTPSFLADTWWYGLSRRLDDKKFEELAYLRSSQGFDAVQMVVGIPPEVGPENQNAASLVGTAWNLSGEFNVKYLENARNRIKQLNDYGLKVIVYGAWGHQIEWLGVDRMKDWWKEVINKLDDLDVMYCLTGESDIWVGEESKLLLDRSTDDFKTSHVLPVLPLFLVNKAKRLINLINEPQIRARKEIRRDRWSDVLVDMSVRTNKPIIVHVLPNRTSEEVINNPEILSAITVQTGHDPGTRNIIWRLPIDLSQTKPDKPFINLEPWYEGITGRFGAEDQLFAYWSSRMAGAHAYCYGAHGIWNVGDGVFLAHWGRQTLDEALKLDTPRLLGLSHNFFIKSNLHKYKKIDVEVNNGELVKITRSSNDGGFVSYIPDISLVNDIPLGSIFLPLEGRLTDAMPSLGQVVVVG